MILTIFKAMEYMTQDQLSRITIEDVQEVRQRIDVIGFDTKDPYNQIQAVTDNVLDERSPRDQGEVTVRAD